MTIILQMIYLVCFYFIMLFSFVSLILFTAPETIKVVVLAELTPEMRFQISDRENTGSHTVCNLNMYDRIYQVDQIFNSIEGIIAFGYGMHAVVLLL